MKKIKGNNNFLLIENVDGSLNEELEIDDKTTVITSSDSVNTFNSRSELQTYIASVSVDKFIDIPDVGMRCEFNKIYKYGKDKVKCLQEHDRTNFTTEETPALWLIIKTVSQSDYPAWKQPTGVHDAYAKGDRVHFPSVSDPAYKSTINDNVWSPATYPQGWKKI